MSRISNVCSIRQGVSTASPDLLRGLLAPAMLVLVIEAGAWTDAGATLIGLELPGWQLRRAAYDGGEWFCSLSRQPNLAAELDDTVDASHEVLSLAMLGAFLEALRRRAVESGSLAATTPAVKPTSAHGVCCDNFA